MTYNLYRFVCTTETVTTPVYKVVKSQTTPTVCPTNAGHTIDVDSITIVSKEYNTYQSAPIQILTASTTYDEASVMHQLLYNIENYGIIKRIKVISLMDPGNTSYDIQVYDRSNTTEIVTGNFNNSSVYESKDLGELNYAQDGDFIIELRAKKNGGTVNDHVYISSFVIYTE